MVDHGGYVAENIVIGEVEVVFPSKLAIRTKLSKSPEYLAIS